MEAAAAAKDPGLKIDPEDIRRCFVGGDGLEGVP